MLLTSAARERLSGVEEEAERYLAGGRPVTTVQPEVTKTWQLDVVVPVEDMADLATTKTPPRRTTSTGEANPARSARTTSRRPPSGRTSRSASSIWWPRTPPRWCSPTHVGLAERLTARLNEIWADRLAAAQTPGDDVVEGENPDTTKLENLDGGAPGLMAGDDARASRPPAQLMGNAGGSRGLPTMLARAHHGSVSKDVRDDIEAELKAGLLPAVVATSSLELGIGMGAIDLVIQVELPPSVASGLQRIGRADHQMGATSHGVLFPKYRGDLLSAALIVDSMRSGRIESLHVPQNPLDVLAQQIVAMVAMDEWARSDLEALVRRAAPFAGLSTSVLDSVLDMLAGLYPSDAFRELRPRLVWDRTADTLSGRSGAQRLAVIFGGTVPDRGGSTASSSPPVRGRGGGSANSTRRWSTNPGSGMSSHSARARGASRTSHVIRCSSPPHPARPRACRSGRVTRWSVLSNSAAPSAPSPASSPRARRRRHRPGPRRGSRRTGRQETAHVPA